jgi:Family of unknown function (DUF6221)
MNADDLAAFLKARIGEDEATWRQKRERGGAHWPWLEDRMLREVEAKRAILAVHAPREGGDGAGAEIQVCQTCSWDGGTGDVEGDPYPCETVRLLGVVYSDHPDYDESWKP